MDYQTHSSVSWQIKLSFFINSCLLIDKSSNKAVDTVKTYHSTPTQYITVHFFYLFIYPKCLVSYLLLALNCPAKITFTAKKSCLEARLLFCLFECLRQSITFYQINDPVPNLNTTQLKHLNKYFLAFLVHATATAWEWRVACDGWVGVGACGGGGIWSIKKINLPNLQWRIWWVTPNPETSGWVGELQPES